MTNQNSSHKLNDAQWQTVKEWVLERKTQSEIQALVLSTFGVSISQPAISNSRHYKDAKKELTAMIAEQSRVELEAHQPLLIRQMVRHMTRISKELDELATELEAHEKGSREYAAISAAIDKLDKNFNTYLIQHASMYDAVTVSAASPAKEEEGKQDVKDTIAALRAARESSKEAN